MGQVSKLNLDVPLKILPEVFALGGDRIARFRREARVLAALNHPNIAAIYGFDSGSTRSSWNSRKARRSRIPRKRRVAVRRGAAHCEADRRGARKQSVARTLIETVVAGGDGLQEVVGDKATGWPGRWLRH
jgi:hypothetical protein